MEEHEIEYNHITFNHSKINFKPPREQGGSSSGFAPAVVLCFTPLNCSCLAKWPILVRINELINKSAASEPHCPKAGAELVPRGAFVQLSLPVPAELRSPRAGSWRITEH